MIKVQDVIETLDVVVREAEPHHRAECYYSSEGEAWITSATAWGEANNEYFMLYENIEPKPTEASSPVCIAGQVVAKLSGNETLAALTEGTVIIASENRNILLDVGFTEAAVAVLGSAQRVQDDGNTWAEALERAKIFAADIDPEQDV